MDYNETSESKSSLAYLLSIIALVLAAIAIILSMMAFNRAGKDVGDIVMDTVEEGVEGVEDVARSAELSAARGVAMTRLVAIKTEAELSGETAQFEDDVRDAKRDLQIAYDQAGEDFQNEWVSIESAFDDLEASLRDNTGDFLNGFETLFGLLEEEVRTDE